MTEVLAAELHAADSLVSATAVLPGTVRSNIAKSLRTRPADGPTGLYEVDLGALDRQFRWLEPDDVGAMVLEAIRADQLYLVTHQEFTPQIEPRYRRIAAS